jgi:hypothetical protein
VWQRLHGANTLPADGGSRLEDGGWGLEVARCRAYLHMNSVVVFSSGKISSRFLKLYWARTDFKMSVPSPMSRTQLRRFSCQIAPQTQQPQRPSSHSARLRFPAVEADVGTLRLLTMPLTHNLFDVELNVNGVGCAVHALRRPELFALEGVCNHD